MAHVNLIIVRKKLELVRLISSSGPGSPTRRSASSSTYRTYRATRSSSAIDELTFPLSLSTVYIIWEAPVATLQEVSSTSKSAGHYPGPYYSQRNIKQELLKSDQS